MDAGQFFYMDTGGDASWIWNQFWNWTWIRSKHEYWSDLSMNLNLHAHIYHQFLCCLCMPIWIGVRRMKILFKFTTCNLLTVCLSVHTVRTQFWCPHCVELLLIRCIVCGYWYILHLVSLGHPISNSWVGWLLCTVPFTNCSFHLHCENVVISCIFNAGSIHMQCHNIPADSLAIV